jgi:hypothetical protein
MQLAAERGKNASKASDLVSVRQEIDEDSCFDLSKTPFERLGKFHQGGSNRLIRD